MINRMLSKAVSNDATALSQNKKEEKSEEVPSGGLFKSLLDSLKGNNASCEQDVLKNLLSNANVSSSSEALKSKEKKQANAILAFLSEGDFEEGKVEKKLQQLFAKLKKQDPEVADQVQKALNGRENTDANAKLRKIVLTLRSDNNTNSSEERSGNPPSDTTATQAEESQKTQQSEEDAANSQSKADSNKIGFNQNKGESAIQKQATTENTALNLGEKMEAAPLVSNKKTAAGQYAYMDIADGQEKQFMKAVNQSAKEVISNIVLKKIKPEAAQKQDQNINKGNDKIGLLPNQLETNTAGESKNTTTEGKDASHAAQKQNGRLELNREQKKIINRLFQNDPTFSETGKGGKIKNVPIETLHSKENEERLHSFAIRSARAEGSRNPLMGFLAFSNNSGREGFSRSGFNALANGSNENERMKLSAKSTEISFKEYIMDGSVKEESKPAQQSSASSPMHLGRMPIINGFVRRNILPVLTRNLLSAATKAKKTPENWQKHNFVLNDGKKIQLSVRESKGMLQVKMGSVNVDLSKLLQQNLQQIREHLREEFGTEIDLQFENQGQEGTAYLSEDSTSYGTNKRNDGNGIGNDEVGPRNNEEQMIPQTVRNFGYNHMEWTA